MARAQKPTEIALSEDVADERGGGLIQSLERGFAILEEVARHQDGITLAELSKRVGLHNSTAFHLAKTMMGLGYLSQVKDSKRYRVGRRLYTLAAGALDEVELVRLAKPVIDKLMQLTGECCNFAVRSGENVIILARTPAPGLFQVSDRLGVIRPSHCTAPGKILTAALTQTQLERYFQTHELKRLTPKTITDAGALLRELEIVRRNGIAFDDCEFDPEVRCVAVPVRDFSGQIIGSIGIAGPIWRLSMHSLQETAISVREAGEQLSRILGYAGGAALPAEPANEHSTPNITLS